MTFQNKVLRFEILTRSMDIPGKYRDINIENIKWLLENIVPRNEGHRHLNEVIQMLREWNDQITKGAKYLK